jgi:hypothetical protein
MSDERNPQPNEHESKKPPYRYWHATESFFDLKASHWVEILLTFALLCVGGTQASIYWRQTGVMQTQADIAAAQANVMKAEHRPWLSMDIHVKSITWKPDGIYVARYYELENTGHSVATYVYVQDAIVPFMRPGGGFHAEVKKILEASKKNPGFGFPVFPGQKRPVIAAVPLSLRMRLGNGWNGREHSGLQISQMPRHLILTQSP